MTKISRYIFIIAIAIIAFATSCDNDVDINDDYKEIPVVYGLLDLSETQHFVKITKAFQTEGNVYVAATDISKSQYNPKDLKMYFEVYNSSNTWIKDISLDTVLITNKDSGAFYYPKQILYATEKNVTLNQDYKYKLVVELLQSGKNVKSETELVGDFSILKPRAIMKTIDFSGKYPTTVEWHSTVNGKLYQLVIRYFYTEIPSSGSAVSHHIDWVMPPQVSEHTDGTEKISLEYAGLAFYELLASKIALPDAGMKRYSDSVQYIITVAHENFAVYLDVNKPSSSIVQERPVYTNISNGVGLFSSRYNKTRDFVGLTTQSLDSLYNGSKTYMLGFEDRP